MPFPRVPTRWFRTLRVRLTMWHTLVMLIAVVGALAAVREGLRFYLLLESDVVLNDEAKELALAIRRWYPNHDQIIAEMEQKAAGHSDRGWHVRWLSPDRRETIWASSLSPQEPLSQVALSLQGHKVWVSDQYRSVERRLEVPGIPEFYVRVGTPTQFIEGDITRLTRIAAPVALCIILLAPLGGFFLSEQAIRPLQQIIHSTVRLRPSQLDERLPTRGVGDELDQLAGQINHFLDQIAEHLRKNRDFVANAAHELRSPLTAILSSVEVSLDKRRSPEEYEELLFSTAEECRHLTQLVNQLLQLTESETGEARPLTEAVPLDDVVSRAIEMFAPVAEESGVTLAAGSLDSVVVQGDRQPLRQLVTNLIDNAIKFTPSLGRVSVRLSKDSHHHEAVLMVADTGIGIPSEDLPRIFERFYQVDRSRSRLGNPRGNGLGLSICEAIVHQHRGTLSVESHLGEGSTFIVRLPLASA